MGVELHPAFNPRNRELLYQAEGKALIDRLRVLRRMAKDRGIAPLSDFMDNREANVHADDFDFDEFQAQWDEWFSPADGLAAVQGLLDAIRSDPHAHKHVKDLETVQHDLEELARCLHKALEQGAQFRLEVH